MSFIIIKLHSELWGDKCLYLDKSTYSDDLSMNNLVIRGEGQDVVANLTTTGSDNENSICVSAKYLI